MMSNNVKEKKFRDGPLTPYFSDESNKNVIYRSWRDKRYDDTDENGDVSMNDQKDGSI